MAFNPKKDEQDSKPTPGTDPNPQNTRTSALAVGSSDYAKLSGTAGQGTRLGEVIPMRGFYLGATSTVGATAREHTSKYRIPAICCGRWFPTYGVSDGNGSAISLIANKLYNKIMDVLKRKSLPYDPTAVVMQLMAMDSVYCAYECAVRAYKAANTTSLDNAYLPAALCRAAGFKYEDMVKNKAQIYFDLVTMRQALTEYLIPKDYALIGRHLEMCRYIFRDSPSNKAQLYVFTPSHLWTWKKVDTHGALVCEPFGTPGSPEIIWKTWSDFKTFWNNMLNAILNSTAFKDINAGIRSVWADSDVYAMDIPAVDEVLEYTQDDGVLSAIANLTNIGNVGTDVINTFAPDGTYPNYFIIKPSMRIKDLPNINTVFNALSESPTASEFVQMAMWHVAFEVEESGTLTTDSKVNVLSCGSEVFTSFTAISDTDRPFFTFKDVAGNAHSIDRVEFPTNSFAEPYASSQLVVVNSFLRIAVASAFRWHPTLFVSIKLANEETLDVGDNIVTMPFGDWNYCSVASSNDIRDWHTAAMFEVTGIV